MRILLLLALFASLTYAKVPPVPQLVLDDLAQMARSKKSFTLVGQITGDFEVAGLKDHYQFPFESTWSTSGAFRTKVGSDAEFGSTGKETYFLNLQTKQFERAAKKSPEDWPRRFQARLIDENLQLYLAVDPKASESLGKAFKDVRIGEPTKIGEQSFDTFIMADDRQEMTVLYDPTSGWIRQVRIDFSKAGKERKAADVKQMLVVVDYLKIEPDLELAANTFDWNPPAGARELEQVVADEDDAADSPAMALVGKSAPPFTLNGMDGKPISLADLKGKVVVLDFWATWCGPCVQSLPKIQTLATKREREGVAFFAVNLKEDKSTVEKFIAKTKLTLTVLLDADGAVGNTYQAQAIPQTVVIGKDGTVKRVLVGFNPRTGEAKLDEAIESALKEDEK